jgi:protein phosphatase
MPKLFIPIGPPGAGKSTFAEMLVGSIIPKTAIVSPDALREILTDDMTNQRANSTVFQIVDTILDTRMKLGLDVYLDATNLQANHLRKVLGQAKSYGHNITFYVFETEEAVLRERNANRDRVVPDHAMDRMIANMKELDIDGIAESYGARIVRLTGQ